MPHGGCHGSRIHTIIGLRDVSLLCAHLSRLRSQGGLRAWLIIDLLVKAYEMAPISKSTQILCELWEDMHVCMHTCKCTHTHTQAHIAFCQSILDIGAAGKYNTPSWVLIMVYKQDQIQSMTEWWISAHQPSSNLRQLRSNRLSSLVRDTVSSAI